MKNRNLLFNSAERQCLVAAHCQAPQHAAAESFRLKHLKHDWRTLLRHQTKYGRQLGHDLTSTAEQN